MGKEMQSINKNSMDIEQVPEAIEARKINKNFDDDGRPNPKRTDVLKVRLQMQIVGQRGPLTGKVHLCIMVIILVIFCCFLEPIAGQPAQGAHASGGHNKIDPHVLVFIFVVVIIFAGPTLVFLCCRCLDCPCTRYQGILVDSLPVVTYPTSDARVRSRDTECSICLGQFAEGDNVSVLPVCEHTFHHHCIRNLIARQDFEWSNLQCPNCRREYYTMRERQSPDFLP